MFLKTLTNLWGVNVLKNINKPLVQTNRMEGIEEEIKDVAEDGTPRHSFMNSDNSLYPRFKNLNLLSESSH